MRNSNVFLDMSMVRKSGTYLPQESGITFPSEEMRHQLTRLKSVEFRTHEIIATVQETSMNPDDEGMLETVSVKISGIPRFAKKEEVVRELAYLAGNSDQVDIITLGRPGPVRVRMGIRDSSLVKGETLVFFNGRHKD